MAFNYSKGSQVIGDLKAADDTQRDTKIDFEEDYIALHTSGSAMLVVSGSKVSIGSDPGGNFPSHKLDINGDIRIRNNNIRDNSGNKAISFDGQANTTISGSLTISGSTRNYTFPTTDGNNGQVLQTNGSGVLTFVDVDGEGGGGGDDGGPQTPEVLKVGLSSSSDLTLSGNGNFQNVAFGFVHFDTFSGSAGWDSGNQRFLAAENGYYDISATIVFDELHENGSYQVWLESDSDHATQTTAFAQNFGYIALVNLSDNPSNTDMATLQVNTIAHLSASQFARIKVRQTNAGSVSPSSKVLGGENRTFICVKKL